MTDFRFLPHLFSAVPRELCTPYFTLYTHLGFSLQKLGILAQVPLLTQITVFTLNVTSTAEISGLCLSS